MSEVMTESAPEQLPVADHVEPAVDATNSETTSTPHVDDESARKKPDTTSGEDLATTNDNTREEV